MSALEVALAADVDALAAKRFVSPMEAGLIGDRHPDTIREALRSGELHGVQRTKGGLWKVRPACLESWLDGELCEHQEEGKRPLSLHDFRMRRVGGRA